MCLCKNSCFWYKRQSKRIVKQDLIFFPVNGEIICAQVWTFVLTTIDNCVRVNNWCSCSGRTTNDKLFLRLQCSDHFDHVYRSIYLSGKTSNDLCFDVNLTKHYTLKLVWVSTSV